MSPMSITALLVTARFPRVSGDEPAARKAIGVPYVFSPRERG